MAAQDSAVLAASKRKKFVQIQKYREAPKERHLGANKNIAVQQKKGSAVKTNYHAAGAETGRLGNDY